MRPHVSALVLLSALPACAQAPAAFPLAPVEPPIRGVRLHPDEAWITRIATLEALPAGTHRVQLTGLPAGLRLDDVRIAARGPAGTRLGELTLRQEPQPYRDLPAWKQTQSDLAAANEQLRQHELAEQSHQMAKDLFEALSEAQQSELRRHLGGEGVKPQVLLDLATAVEGRTLELARTRVDLDRERERLQTRKAQLEQTAARLQTQAEARPVRVMAELTLARSGSAEVEVTYRCRQASWTPAYEARLSADRSRLELVLFAAVRQASDEDWRGVALELANQGAATQLDLPGGMSTPSLSFKESEPPKAMPPSVEAGPSSSQIPMTFQVPGTVDVPRQEDQRFRVTSLDLAPTFRYLALPRQTSQVYLLALVTPPPTFPVIPGSPLQLLQGQERLGTLTLEAPAAGEPLRLSFGGVPGLSAYRMAGPKGFREVGDKTKEREWTFQERLVVSSTLDTPAEVEVLDRRVASLTESIAVNDTEDTTPGWEEPQPGLRSWRLTLAPRAQASLQLGLKIRGPLVGRLLNTGDLSMEGTH